MKSEIQYIRELAKKQLEYALSAENKKREELWYRHNSLNGQEGFPVVVEEDTFFNGVCPQLKCEDPLLREMEYQIVKNIWARENINDDKVTPDFFSMYPIVDINWFGINFTRIYDSNYVGYHTEKVIEVIEDDFDKISHTRLNFREEDTKNKAERAQEILGNILPVRFINPYNI